MLDRILPFFSTDLLMPHGHCYLWKPELVGLHILSDSLIALAYYSIPLTLSYFVRRRRDLPFTWVFLLFSAFIVACGTTHLLEIWTLWHPSYWLSGGMKLITAVISLTTAIVLVPIVPQALALPSPAQLEAANGALQQEIAERKRIEAELIRSRDLREAIFNESADALFLIDPQTLLTVDCNRRAVELFQAVDKASLIGIDGQTLQRDQFTQAELHDIGAEMRSQGVWSREIESVTCQGNVFCSSIAAKIITVAEQAVNLVQVTDITERKQAELAVSRLAAIVESSSDAIISKSLEGTITSWNASAEKLFGYTAAEAIGQSIAMLFPPDRATELAQILEQIQRGETIESYETVRVRQDGQRIETDVTISPIKDVTGRVIGAAKITRDITARKQTEAALRESESRFQTFMDNSPAAAWITDAAGRMLYTSQTYSRLFQVPNEVMGKTLSELYAPEIATQFLRHVRQVMETDRPVDVIEVAPRPDGTLGEFLVYKFPIHELSGQRVVGGVAVDITEREQAKKALRSLNERLHYLLTNAPVVIFSCKAEGDFAATSMSENVRTILGHESHAFLEDSGFWATQIHPDDRDRFFAQMPQIFATGHHTHEYRFLHGDGDYHWVYAQLQLMRDEAGNPIEMIGYLVDISKRKQAETTIQQSELRYRAIVEDQTEFIVRFQPDGTLTFVNDAFCRYFGMARENLVGHRYEPVVFAEDRDRVDQLVGSINQTNPIVVIENRIVVGEAVRWSQWVNRALFDDQGDLSEIQAVGRDVHDLKQAAIALSQSEARNRALVQAMPDLLIRMKQDGTYLDIQKTGNVPLLNPALMLTGNDIYAILPPDEARKRMEHVQQALQTRTLQVYEYQLKVDDKMQFEEARIVPCGEDEVLVIVRDITDRKQTEEALRRYERIVSATTDAILLIDRNYIYQVVNQAYLNLYDKRQDEVVGHSIIDVIPQELFESTVKPRLDQCLAGQALQFELWASYPTLGQQFLSITYDPYFDTNQSITGVVVGLRNITKLKQAEVKLELQSIVVKNMAEGVCMVKVSDGIFVYANPKFEQMFGYDADELMGQHVSIVNYEDKNTNTAATFETLARAILEQGEATYEVHNVKKDGTPFWCQATTAVFEHPNYGAVFVVVQQDITDRKQAEGNLRDLSNRLTLALKSGAIGTWDWDITANRLTWDDRMYELYGITPDQSTNSYETWANGLHPDDRPLAEAASKQALAGEKEYEPEFRVRHPDGTVRCLKAYAVVERDQAGAPRRMIGINYDITALKQTAEQIKASLKEKEVLLKEIHHRVKNNLGVVDGLLQMQSRRSQNAEVIEILKESQNRIASIALVHEKLYGSDELAEIDFAHYIADLTTHLFHAYNIHASQIKLVVQADQVLLDIDTAIPCGLIINELVSNALKYAFPKGQTGEIQVTLQQRQDQSLDLIVRDNGIGLPQDFDLKQTKTLGMNLVKGLVKQLRGTLEINGEPGTTVIIIFARDK